jgi:hypothetical protein
MGITIQHLHYEHILPRVSVYVVIIINCSFTDTSISSQYIAANVRMINE